MAVAITAIKTANIIKKPENAKLFNLEISFIRNDKTNTTIKDKYVSILIIGIEQYKYSSNNFWIIDGAPYMNVDNNA